MTIQERFWKHVTKTEGCWIWTASVGSKGYGQIFCGIGKSPVRTHRLSWEIHHSQPIPEGLLVMHRCDNRRCVNPKHLFLGTERDNTLDMLHKDRCGTTKLSVSEVRQIRESGGYLKDIAERFSVHLSNVSLIKRGRTWKHV